MGGGRHLVGGSLVREDSALVAHVLTMPRSMRGIGGRGEDTVPLLSVRQAAWYFSVDEKTIRRWIAAGWLKATPVIVAGRTADYKVDPSSYVGSREHAYDHVRAKKAARYVPPPRHDHEARQREKMREARELAMRMQELVRDNSDRRAAREEIGRICERLSELL